MYWADTIAEKIKKRNNQLEWVDDMKTPSGRIHVGSLRGVVVHDLVFKALRDAGVKVKYTYLFESSDPMDDLPAYLPKEKFEKYLGLPLFKIPSPEPGYKNYAEYFALEFKEVFTTIGCNPEIIWTADLYSSGKMNDDIKVCLDKAAGIRTIYEELYKKPMASDWYPFQVYCEQCDKVVTTKVYNWDGTHVFYRCIVDAVDWTKGCGYEGSVSPFSSKEKITGKLPWKVEWPVKWKVVGVTVEGAGKDHMSAGGSHDFAKLICERVINYPVPFPVPYEFFLIGGKKMSSSKGRGSSAADMLQMLPPEILRFLMVKTKINQAINFDPAGDTIPKLFDEYQKAADAYFNKENNDLAREFELSQINTIQKPPTVRFSVLAQWIQMPNMQSMIEKEGLTDWVKYAKLWIDKYAPDSEKFLIAESLPAEANNLSDNQKKYLTELTVLLDKNPSAEELQVAMYDLSKTMAIPSKEAFAAIYTVLIGKNHGPRAAWLLLSLPKEFLKQRIIEATKTTQANQKLSITQLNRSDIFSIDSNVTTTYPTISVGVAIIKGVQIKKTDENLEKEKNAILASLSGLTTEQLGQYPEILAYRKLYKAMNIDWHSRRPSPEALLRRIALNKGLYTVNTCVDAYNLVVLKNRISVGAFDLDTIKFPTILRFPKPSESILLLGDDQPTEYKPAELAYFDQDGGFNIDFNYRDSQRTAVKETTTNLYINVDGIYDIPPTMVERVLRETCEIITKYCGGTVDLFGVEATE
jgi:lysyl-tRNA synthetase class 1